MGGEGLPIVMAPPEREIEEETALCSFQKNKRSWEEPSTVTKL